MLHGMLGNCRCCLASVHRGILVCVDIPHVRGAPRVRRSPLPRDKHVQLRTGLRSDVGGMTEGGVARPVDPHHYGS